MTDSTPVYAAHLIQQAVAAQFASRPTVRSAVTQLLTERLNTKFRQHAFDVNTTYVVLTVDDEGKPLGRQRYRLLLDIVLEHVANQKPLNYRYYSASECFVAMSEHVPPAGGFSAIEAMSAIEPVLLNVIAVWQVALQDALTTYWNQPADTGGDRLHWLAQMIQDQLRQGVSVTPHLSDGQRTFLLQVLNYPNRNNRLNKSTLDRRTKVYSVAGTFEAEQTYHLLTSEILIEYVEGRKITYCHCKANGSIEWFSLLDQFTLAWSTRFTDRYVLKSVKCELYEPGSDFLDTQAMCILERQLAAIMALSRPLTLAELERQVAIATDPAVAFSAQGESDPPDLTPVYNALPEWLRGASIADRYAYRSHLIALASVYKEAKGKRFNDDISDLYTFAANALQAQMRRDQPLAPGYHADDLLLTFVDPLGPGGEGTVGTLNKYTLTLTELAVENLTAVRSSHMTITHAKGQLIQSWWLTPAYVKNLVTRVNIGQRYPQWIYQRLLSTVDEAQRREKLYSDELRELLVLQALECKVRKTSYMTESGYQMIKALMQLHPEGRVVGDQAICIRPLTLLSVPSLPPHVVAGMFVIGPVKVNEGRHILYRPLHRQPLIEYPSWSALFAGIAQPGAVQNSVLQWLPDSARRLYEAGGFYRMNLASQNVHEASSFPIPAGAAKLSESALSADFMHTLYASMSATLTELADRQSVSNTEQRWQSLITGGWLLFSTVIPNLPLTWPLRMLTGMTFTYLAVQKDIETLRSMDEHSKAPAVIDLLFNCAVVLLHLTPATTRLAPRAVVSDNEWLPDSVKTLAEMTSLVRSAAVELANSNPVEVPVGNRLTALDFSWFNNPRIKLTQWQLSWLDRNRAANVDGEMVGVTRGEYKGLLTANRKMYAIIDGFLYPVQFEDDDVYLVSPHDPQDRGPRIVGDDAGVWRFDVRVRLLGGGPKKRLWAMREQRNKRYDELREKLTRYNSRAKELEAELEIAQNASDRLFHKDAAELLPERRAALKELIAVLERQKPEYTEALELFLEKQTIRPEDKDPTNLIGFYKYLVRLTSTLYDCHILLTGVHQLQYPEVYSLEGRFVRVDLLESVAYRLDCLAQVATLEKSAGYFLEMDRYIQKLRDVPKLGHEAAVEAKKLYVGDSSTFYRSAVICRAHQLVAYIDLIVQTPGSEEWITLRQILSELYYTADSQHELVDPDLFSAAERTEILNDIRERYARAEDRLGVFREGASSRLFLPVFERMLLVIKELDRNAETMLLEQARLDSEWLPAQSVPARVPHYTRKIIRTRKRGILIGKGRSAEGETDIADVGGAAEVQGSHSGPSSFVTASFQQTAPGQWVEVQIPQLPVSARPLGVLKAEANALIDSVNTQIHRVKSYAKRSKFPLELEEILDRYAQKLDKLGLEIRHAAPDQPPVDTPRPGTVPMYLKRLAVGARHLREQGVELLWSLPPTAATVESLLERQQVSLVKINARISMRGERQDFVQEYEIKNTKGRVLWYAHLHYPDLNTPAQKVNTAHFKLASQRYMSQRAEDAKAKPGSVPTQVYYGAIHPAMLTRRFLPLEVQ